MIIVAGSVRVAPDKLEALRPHAKAIIEATRAETGCVVYAFAEDLLDRGLVRIFEVWESREHLDAHLKQPHMAPWRKALVDLGASGRDIKRYQAEAGESF